MELNTVIGQKLVKIRELSGYKQEKFSEKLGYSIRTIKRYEKGEIPDKYKTNVAKIYSTYCDEKERKPQITQELILNDGKTATYLEKIWRGISTKIDTPDFEPAETMLEIPTENDAELDEPEFFRLTGPEYTDFKNGFVYKDDAQIAELLTLLKKNKIVLLSSKKPASGKSVIARTIAFEKSKNGLKTIFFQVSSEYNKQDLSRIIDQIIEFGNIDSNYLIIIEDAHLNPNFVNDLLKKRDIFSSEILITSRSIPKISKRAGKNIFNELETLVFEPSTEFINGIIKCFCKQKFPGSDSKINEVSTVLNGVYNQNIWGNSVNLWLLSYAFRAIKSKDENESLEISSQDILDEVKEDLEDITNGNSFRAKLIIALSVLSRFEIFTDIQFLIEQFRYKDPDILRDTLEVLCSEGVLIRSKVNSRLFQIPHSSLAELYFEFTKPENGSFLGHDASSNESEYIWSYIVSDKTCNWIDVIEERINDSRLSNILQNNIDIPKLNHKIDALDNIFDTFKVLRFVHYNSLFGREIAVKSLNLEKLSEKMRKEKDLLFINECIKFIIKAPIEKRDGKKIGKDLVKKLVSPFYGKIIIKSENLFQIQDLIKTIYHISNVHGKQLIEQIGVNELFKRIENDHSLYSSGKCLELIDLIMDIPGETLWENLNLEIIVEKINKTDHVGSIGEFFEVVFNISPNAGFELWDAINKDKVIRRIDKYDTPCYPLIFLKNIYAGPSGIRDEVWKKIKQPIIDKIIADENIENIGKDLLEAYKINPSMSTELLNSIGIQKIANGITRDNRLRSIVQNIEPIHKIFKNSSQKLIKEIGTAHILRKIKRSENLFKIVQCIGVLLNASPEDGEIIWQKIDQDNLARRIVLSGELSSLKSMLMKEIMGSNVDIGIKLLEKIDIYESDFREDYWT